MRVIIYTSSDDDRVKIIVPVRESPTSGIRVLKIHKTIVFPDDYLESEEGMQLPYMIDVTHKKWNMHHVRRMANWKNITLTDQMVVLEDEDLFLDRICSKTLPEDSTNVSRMEEDDVIKDRVFRDEWECAGGALSVNMQKARLKHMSRIRLVRGEALIRLDKEWTKFKGQKKEDLADSVESTRQALRDIPETFDLSVHETPEALKAAWPELLERREQENNLRLPELRKR